MYVNQATLIMNIIVSAFQNEWVLSCTISQPRQILKQLQMTQSSCFGCAEKQTKATIIWTRDREIIQQTKFLFCRLKKFPRFSAFAYLQFEMCLFVSCFFFFRSFFDRVFYWFGMYPLKYYSPQKWTEFYWYHWQYRIVLTSHPLTK